MPFFGNRRRDFSIQPPRQQVDGTPFFVTDSANIDFTLSNLNLTADLTFTGVTAGTYGSSTQVPVLQIDQWGRITGVTLVTISGGGGGTYTVNNGLSAQTIPSANPNNFQLGGSLIQNTTITNNGFDFIVSRTSAGNAIEGINTVGSGILGDSISNTGVIGISDTNTGVSGLSNTGIPIIGTVFSATNNDIKTVLRLINSNLSPANGTGSAIEFRAGTSASPQVVSGKLSFLWTDVNSSTRTSKFQVETINLGNALNKLEINGPGQLKLNRYGQTPALFPGTAVWSLGVDVSGNVVEFTPSISNTYTVNNGLTENPFDNFQLGSTTSGGAPLLHDTYIDTVVNHTLYLEGQKTNSSDAILSIDNTASGGTALRVTGSGSSAAVNAQSTDNYGVFGTSNTFFGIVGQTLATARAGVLAEVISNSFSSVLPALRIRHLTSGTPLVGFGAAIDFRAATVSNSESPLGRLMYQWTDPITISRTSKFQLETVNLNAAAIKLEVDGPGQLTLNQYTTSTSFAGASGISVGVLNVDSAGKVFVGAGGGPGGDSIGQLTGDVDTILATSSTEVMPSTLKANLKIGSFGVSVDGITSVVQVGQVGYVVMPYAGTITGWSITANASGNISFDITSASGAIPTVSIIGVGGNYPTLTSPNQFITSTTMTNWTLGFAAGDVFGFIVRPTPSIIKNATLTIKVNKT